MKVFKVIKITIIIKILIQQHNEQICNVKPIQQHENQVYINCVLTEHFADCMHMDLYIRIVH